MCLRVFVCVRVCGNIVTVFMYIPINSVFSSFSSSSLPPSSAVPSHCNILTRLYNNNQHITKRYSVSINWIVCVLSCCWCCFFFCYSLFSLAISLDAVDVFMSKIKYCPLTLVLIKCTRKRKKKTNECPNRIANTMTVTVTTTRMMV